MLKLSYRKQLSMSLGPLPSKVAETLGLSVTGTIGILLKAEKSGLIESAYNKAKELKDKGFHVSEELLENISKFKRT